MSKIKNNTTTQKSVATPEASKPEYRHRSDEKCRHYFETAFLQTAKSLKY